MPVPIILGGIALGTAVYGAVKTAGSISDGSKADGINQDARHTVRDARDEIEECRVECNKILEEYGIKKYEAVTDTLNNFVNSYSQLKNVELLVKGELDELGLGDFDGAKLKSIQKDISLLESSAIGLGTGATGGAFLAFGAYNGTMMLGAASTGTAISSLSGVAATNATLAWLGGGSLAAGGFGMAGGMMMLGGIVAGPALAIFGLVLSNGASEKLSGALSNMELAEAFQRECDVVHAKLKGIIRVASFAADTLSICRAACREATDALAEVIKRSGVDYSSFSNEDQETVFKSVKLAQLVKAIVDTPVLDKDGSLLGDSEVKLRSFKDVVHPQDSISSDSVAQIDPELLSLIEDSSSLRSFLSNSQWASSLDEKISDEYREISECEIDREMGFFEKTTAEGRRIEKLDDFKRLVDEIKDFANEFYERTEKARRILSVYGEATPVAKKDLKNIFMDSNTSASNQYWHVKMGDSVLSLNMFINDIERMKREYSESIKNISTKFGISTSSADSSAQTDVVSVGSSIGASIAAIISASLKS